MAFIYNKFTSFLSSLESKCYNSLPSRKSLTQTISCLVNYLGLCGASNVGSNPDKTLSNLTATTTLTGTQQAGAASASSASRPQFSETVPMDVSHQPVTTPEPTSKEPPSFYELTKYLSQKQLEETRRKWSSIDNLQSKGESLCKAVRTADYTDPIFSDPDLDYIALYAGNPDSSLKIKLLTDFEIATVLHYSLLIRDYGRENVSVHFLTDSKGGVNEKEKGYFKQGTEKLLSEEHSFDGMFDNLVNDLPRHHQIFFTLDREHEKGYNPFVTNNSDTRSQVERFGFVPFLDVKVENQYTPSRFVITPLLFEKWLQLLVPDSPCRIKMAIGECSVDDFEDFNRRIYAIPFIGAPFPVEVDRSKLAQKIDFVDHDKFHCVVDRYNPHLKFYEGLWKAILNLPYVDGTRKSFPFATLKDRLYDRLMDGYVNARFNRGNGEKKRQVYSLVEVLSREIHAINNLIEDERNKQELLQFIAEYLKKNSFEMIGVTADELIIALGEQKREEVTANKIKEALMARAFETED